MITKLVAFLGGGWIGWLITLGGVVAVLAGIWLGFQHWKDSLRQEGRDEILADWDEDVSARRLEYVGAMEAERVRGAQHAIDMEKSRERRKRDAAVVDTVRAAADGTFLGLRDTSAAVASGVVQACGAGAAGPGADDLAEASRSVFDECSARRKEVAGDAEFLADQVRGLQDYAASALMLCGRRP